MVQTEAEICNMALSRIGEVRISDLSDLSEEAYQCKLFYYQTRDEVLRDYPWNFAGLEAELAPLSDTNLTPFEYKYQLPLNCLNVRILIDIAGESYADLEDEYRVGGRAIYTNVSPCAIRYTQKVEDPGLFDSCFVEAFALKLASKIAFNLTGDRALEADMLQQYITFQPVAKSLDGFESRNKKKKKKYWDEYGR